MKKHKIRKGLESPLIVYGLRQPFFTQFLIAVAIGGGIAVSNITASLHSVPRKWGRAALGVIVIAAVLIIVYAVLVALSQRKKHSFPKKESIISNRDLHKYL